jgi:hypothetical protein
MLLAHELTERGIELAIEVHSPRQAWEPDRAGHAAIIEIKAVANIMPAYDAQVLTWLRISGLRLGLLFNFHARPLQDGPRRFVV